MQTENIIPILLVILFVGSVTSSVALSEFYKSNAPRTCEEFLAVGYIWLPEKVSTLFMEERLDLHFSMFSGKNITVYGVVKNHGIFDLTCEPSSNPDADVWMDDVTAFRLATSTTPITTFVTSWRSGSIFITPHNKETEDKLASADYLLKNDYEPVPVAIRAIFDRFLA